MVDKKMKGTFGGVVLGVVMLLVAFNVSGQTVDVEGFVIDDLESAEGSSTNANYTDGDLSINGTSTSASYSSNIKDLANGTTVAVYLEDINSNNTVNATVEAFDDGGSSLGTVDSNFLDSGRNDVDLTGSFTVDNVDAVKIDLDLARDSSSDTSPTATLLEGYQEGTTPYLQYLVAIFGIAVMLFSLRGL